MPNGSITMTEVGFKLQDGRYTNFHGKHGTHSDRV